jgi:hypothetical protein
MLKFIFDKQQLKHYPHQKFVRSCTVSFQVI